jgi:hypothetical protein
MRAHTHKRIQQICTRAHTHSHNQHTHTSHALSLHLLYVFQDRGFDSENISLALELQVMCKCRPWAHHPTQYSRPDAFIQTHLSKRINWRDRTPLSRVVCLQQQALRSWTSLEQSQVYVCSGSVPPPPSFSGAEERKSEEGACSRAPIGGVWGG